MKNNVTNCLLIEDQTRFRKLNAAQFAGRLNSEAANSRCLVCRPECPICNFCLCNVSGSQY